MVDIDVAIQHAESALKKATDENKWNKWYIFSYINIMCLAEILFDDEKLFYNPIQEFNRDLSTTAIKIWSQIYLKEKSKNDLKYLDFE